MAEIGQLIQRPLKEDSGTDRQKAKEHVVMNSLLIGEPG